ncbi:MAG: Fe-S cluster assembly protein SufD [Verrucomicrobia bacterium]|nr:Fe-S cluster assembly protein SufD [Verrucomicrobiota bacterium]MBS0645666.1 Fe-S cluster assembly protein SufD [Verrucomicrobiota bacterium]
MTTLEALEHTFLECIEPLRGHHPWQERAWARFIQLGGLPAKNLESYRYLSLRNFYQSASVQLPLVMPVVPSSVKILPLREAYTYFHSYLDKQIATWLEYEKDPLALMSGALEQPGLFLYVPPNTKVEKPIFISQPSHFFVYVAKGASCSLRLLRQQDEEAQGWIYRKLDAHVDEDAKLHIQFEPHPSESLHFDAVRASLKRSAQFYSLALPAQSKLARQDYHVRLLGEGADAKLYGLVQSHDHEQQHVHVLMEHAAAHTTSWQHFKAVLDDHSRHSFEGKIYIHPQAQKTDAYQMHQTLILSSKAESKSKPNLEIFADDVKASHGATCGQLDQEALFYLKARGLHQEQAKKLLIQAFCAEVLHGLLT